MNRYLPKSRGFTLLEILVVVAIIGILASIAYPMYGAHLVKGNRGAAQSHLLELAQAQTQYMVDTRTYADSVAALSTSTPATVSEYYTIRIEVQEGTPSSYVISATPIPGKRQANDGTLSIDSTGKKTPAEKW
jgi:type IV pilus assembly protein PilE